jgi:enoyl-CoA hydratase
VSGSTVSDGPVLVRVQGRLGRLTLNRPEKINALDAEMVRLVRAALARWRDDPAVAVVLIDGAGDRGLCSGGDVRALWHAMRGEGEGTPQDFWIDEYAMNAELDEYPLPVVTLMDGLVLGGGVGISTHGSVRVVTERSVVGMPETAIGLAPDVGALHLLASAPGSAGVRMALTGIKVDGPTAITCGLADHLVPSAELPTLIEILQDGTVPAFAEVPLVPVPDWVQRCWSARTVEEILERLATDPDPAAAADLALLRQMSPTALKVTLEAVHRAETMTLREVLAQDLVVSSAFARHPDLPEGIRAKIIDKDGAPRWQPAELAEVGDAEVRSYFDVPEQWRSAVRDLAGDRSARVS